MVETRRVDFDELSWHDNTLYGWRFEVGDPERGTWHADLVLDIDHIVAWVPGAGAGTMMFGWRRRH